MRPPPAPPTASAGGRAEPGPDKQAAVRRADPDAQFAIVIALTRALADFGVSGRVPAMTPGHAIAYLSGELAAVIDAIATAPGLHTDEDKYSASAAAGYASVMQSHATGRPAGMMSAALLMRRDVLAPATRGAPDAIGAAANAIHAAALLVEADSADPCDPDRLKEAADALETARGLLALAGAPSAVGGQPG